MLATVLKTYADVQAAGPGLYVVRSGSDAFFPAMALIEADAAELRGEVYDEAGHKIVTFNIPGQSGLGATGELGAAGQITIGREFFITALKDYRDWKLKWWREAVQNGVDAGASAMELGAQRNDDGTWTVYAQDNGSGMTEETLINKFLVLGATTKIAAGGAAGGFGKAKELLLLPWITWRVHTRDIVVEGAGIDYNVQSAPYLNGTRLEIVMPADNHTDAPEAIAFIEKCDLPQVAFTVNGKPYQAALQATRPVGEVPGKAQFYFTPGEGKQAYLYVRARGLFMFERYVGDIPGYLLAELTAPSIEILTANRDGFRDQTVAWEIDRLAERIAKDNMSALKGKRGLIRQKFSGTGKFRAKQMAANLLEQIGPTRDGKKLDETDTTQVVRVIDHFRRRDEEAAQPKVATLPSSTSAQAMLDQKFLGPTHLEAALKQLVWEPDFFIVNDIEGFLVPKKFFPETMSPRVLKLAKTWVEMVRYVMMQLGSEEPFGVGWIFSADIGAAALTTASDRSEYGVDYGENWIMLNPFRLMREGDIWHPTSDADLKWLYAAAIHECTHIADGLSYHDESFAAALTRNMAKTADGFRKIRAIVAGIRMRGGAEADV